MLSSLHRPQWTLPSWQRLRLRDLVATGKGTLGSAQPPGRRETSRHQGQQCSKAVGLLTCNRQLDALAIHQAPFPHVRSFTVEQRTGVGSWAAVTGMTDQTATLSGIESQRSFQISGLGPGLYRVKVWGRIMHPNDGQQIEVTSGIATSEGDHSTYMRDGTIAVGMPGMLGGVGSWGRAWAA